MIIIMVEKMNQNGLSFFVEILIIFWKKED